MSSPKPVTLIKSDVRVPCIDSAEVEASTQGTGPSCVTDPVKVTGTCSENALVAGVYVPCGKARKIHLTRAFATSLFAIASARCSNAVLILESRSLLFDIEVRPRLRRPLARRL